MDQGDHRHPGRPGPHEGAGQHVVDHRDVGPDPWDVTAMARDVRDEVARVGADVAVVDYMLPGALVGAEAAGVPVVALVHTL